MHIRFDAVFAKFSAPSPPQGTAEISPSIDRFVSGDGHDAREFPWLGVLARGKVKWDVLTRKRPGGNCSHDPPQGEHFKTAFTTRTVLILRTPHHLPT